MDGCVSWQDRAKKLWESAPFWRQCYYVSLKYVKSCYVGSAGLEQGWYRDLLRAFQFVLCNTSIFVAIGVGLIFHQKKLCTLTSACVWQHWRVCHPSSWWWSCHTGCPGSHLSSSETRAAASPWPSCLLTGRWPEYLRSVTVSCKRALTLVEDREDLWLTQGMWKQSIISGNPKDAV